MPDKTRDPAFDLMKFIAIFMVVYWHVMSYRSGFDLATMPSYAANFIISVNMPLFFMVSGYFSRRLHESGDWRRLANRLVKYFWPITTFAFFFALVESIVEHKYSIAAIPLWTLKKFLFGHWFFFALALCDVIIFLSVKYGRTNRARAFLGIMAFVVCLSASGRIWHWGVVV